MKFTIPKIIGPNDVISLNLTGSTATEYDYTGATTYSIGDIRKVSYAIDGTTAIIPVKTFKALSATNTYPPDNAAVSGGVWEDLGAVNRDRMWDGFIDTSAYADGTETTDPGKIVFELNAGRQGKISLFNVEATKVTFEVKDSLGVVVETSEYNLNTVVGDLEEYFFKDFQTSFDVVHAFLSLLKSTIKVTIEHEDAGYYPGCGFVVIGEDIFVGTEINNPRAGFTGFKTADDFKTGGQISRYPYEEVINLDVRVKTVDLNKIHPAVAAIRDRATLFEGINNIYDAFTTLGVLQDYSILYKGDRYCECNFQIGGIK